jgi:hypothetical protein
MSLIATSVALALISAGCGGAADTTAALTEAAVAGANATTLTIDETSRRRRESSSRTVTSTTSAPTSTALTSTALTSTALTSTALTSTASTPTDPTSTDPTSTDPTSTDPTSTVPTLTAPISTAPISTASSQVLLSPSDITYVGYYDLQTDGLDTPWTRGLAVRRIGSEVRLLMKRNNGPFIEVSLAGKTPTKTGSTVSNQITKITRSWPTTLSTQDNEPFIYWDETKSRLFFTYAVDYPNDTQELGTRIHTARLTDGVGTTEQKRLSLDGVPDRRAGTGIVKIPSQMQATWGVGPFAIGLGGYFSRMAQRGEAAMGLSMYAFPDPAPYADSISLPTSSYQVLAARGSTPYGRSLELPLNAYTSAFQSPGMDGLGYWVWGDKYVGGFFVDSPTKKGFVAIASLGTGKNWYENSTLNYEGQTTEAHIYDPDELGKISRGLRSAIIDPIYPNMKALSETRSNSRGANQFAATAAYDEIDNIIYVMMWGKGSGSSGYWNRLYAYKINI